MYFFSKTESSWRRRYREWQGRQVSAGRLWLEFLPLFLFLFRGCFAVLPPSHEGRVVYVTQAVQGVMINYGSAPHISPLRSLRLTVSGNTLLLFVFKSVRGVLIDIQVGSV
jgi:hypothetical protein